MKIIAHYKVITRSNYTEIIFTLKVGSNANAIWFITATSGRTKTVHLVWPRKPQMGVLSLLPIMTLFKYKVQNTDALRSVASAQQHFGPMDLFPNVWKFFILKGYLCHICLKRKIFPMMSDQVFCKSKNKENMYC